MITIRCTRSRGPGGFFCLQVDRRGPVIVDVIRLLSALPRMNPYTPPNEQSNQSTHRTQDVRTTASRWVTFLNWFSVVSLPAFLLTIFVGLGFALGPLRTSYNSPIRGLSLLFSTVCLFAGPFITAYMIRRNLLQKQVLWILPQAIAAAGWVVVAYCLIGGIMGIH